MIPQAETRRLAAVMFADIEGYTALFQRNESAAIRQVNDHRKDLEHATEKHRGQIIQFYGDGSATIFESVIDAVRCAIDLQLSSARLRIPLRIGIHMGDLIMKDGDIFGDVVNVASRIQSAGIPGSILVSRKVVDELANHPDVHTARIGMFSLKNVKQRVELFAVAERGLAIPPLHHEGDKRKIRPWTYFLLLAIGLLILAVWFKRDLFGFPSKKFGKDLICIPPFKDHTLRPEFKETGIIVASLLSKGLDEISEAKVVSYESLIRYFNSDLTPLLENPFLAKRTGASLSLDGHYKLTGEKQDSLLFWGKIINLRTKETIIHLPEVTCAANKDNLCIDQLVNDLTGYWESRGGNVFEVPNGDAYEAYMKAVDIWADEAKIPEAKQHLLRSIRYDTNFLDAYFLLLDLFNNNDEYASEADSISLIKRRFTNMNERQKNYLRFYEEDLNGRNREAVKYFLKEYENNPRDLVRNTTGMVLAAEYLNDPATTLRFYNEIDLDSFDLNVCVYCRTRANMALQAYLDRFDFEHARKMAEKLKPYAEKRAQVSKLILYFLTIGDTSQVEELVTRHSRSPGNEDIRPYYYRHAAQYAILLGSMALSHHYAGKALSLLGNTMNWTAGRCLYLLGEIPAAEKIYKAETRKHPEDKWLLGDLGIIYANLGKTKEANEIISRLKAQKQPYDFGETPYLQGRIKAHLGQPAEALKFLDDAIEEGIKFGKGTTFQHDPNLIILNTEPEYLKLLAKNRLPAFPR